MTRQDLAIYLIMLAHVPLIILLSPWFLAPQVAVGTVYALTANTSH